MRTINQEPMQEGKLNIKHSKAFETDEERPYLHDEKGFKDTAIFGQPVHQYYLVLKVFSIFM